MRKSNLSAQMPQRFVVAFAVLSSALIPASLAAVSDIEPADVTTRAFSIVWASDEPVTGATVRVFAEADGTTELTGGLSVVLLSPAAALTNGVVKVDVRGVAADTCFYYQTDTTTSSFGRFMNPGCSASQ